MRRYRWPLWPRPRNRLRPQSTSTADPAAYPAAYLPAAYACLHHDYGTSRRAADTPADDSTANDATANQPLHHNYGTSKSIADTPSDTPAGNSTAHKPTHKPAYHPAADQPADALANPETRDPDQRH